MAKKKGAVAKAVAKQEAKDQKKKRQEQKATSKVAKRISKKDAREASEDNIEAILAEILKKEEQKTAVTVTVCESPPSPRANFTVTSLPNGDMVLFGGEYFDGLDTKCFNELFRWNVEKNEWRQIESPNTPPPRCSHQAAFFRNHLYVLGGEFATTEQFYHYKDFWRLDIKTNAWEKLGMNGKAPSARSGHRMVVWRNQLVLFGGFYEAFRDTKWFNDLYMMNFQDLSWRQVDTPVTTTIPAPRSGHQMAVHGGGDQIFLYGGWSKEKEPGQKKEGKTHNDMWVLNMKAAISGGNPTWDRMGKKGAPPSIRSGAAMTVHKNRALLFGGVLDHEGPQHAVRSVFYNDLFAFDMERRRWYHLALKKKKKAREKDKGAKKIGGSGGGGSSMNQGDEDDEDEEEEEKEKEEDEDYIDSDDERDEGEKASHENAFVYIDNSGKLVYVEAEDDGDGDDEDHDGIQERGAGVLEDDSEGEEKQPGGDGLNLPGKVSTVPAEEKQDTPPPGDEGQPSPVSAADVQLEGIVATTATPAPENVPGEQGEEEEEAAPCPLPRINPCLTVRGNTLYVYGGLLEVGDREFTLDDCWSLELNTRTSWTRVQAGSMDEQMWKGEEEESELGSEFGEEEDYDESDEDSEQEEDGIGQASAGMTCLSLAEGGEEESKAHDPPTKPEKASKKSKKEKSGKKGKGGVREEIRQLQEELGVDDSERTPQAGEMMRDFFDRTKLYWTTEIIRRREEAAKQGDVKRMTEKELRRDAFTLAGERYAELEPSLKRLNALEAEQREFEAREVEKRRAQKASGPRGSRR